MSSTAWIVVIAAIVVVVVIVAAAWMMSQQRRSRDLKGRFGPEYDRTVDRVGNKGRAESLLEQRQQRVEKLQIRDLTQDERSRYAGEWRSTQARFVDSPGAAVNEAEDLVTRAMQSRGYRQRFRATCSRRFGRSPYRRLELSLRPADRAQEPARRGQHRGFAAGDGALPIAVR